MPGAYPRYKKKPKKAKRKKKYSKTKKKPIPKALREQLWIKYCGKTFEHKCFVSWCDNMINVFDYHVGHDNPESKGGTLSLQNLKPLCSRCNLSMSNNFTIKEWNNMMKPPKSNQKTKWFCCF